MTLIILAGCTSPDEGGGTPPADSTNNFLKPTAFSGNVLQAETRFISYSKKANRVSIIDPQLEVEVWGKSAPGFDFAVALPDFQGGSLFANDRVVVMSGDTQKTFPLSKSYAYVASALQTAAYSLASVDGQTFEVIRSLGSGQWQQENFTVPWGAVDPTYSQAPAGQPVLLVAYYNNYGTKLVAFAPADGRYAVFEASTPADKIQNTSNWCVGDGVGTVDDATFRSLAWDEARQTYYAGDKNGKLYAFNPFGACLATIDVNQITLPDSMEITQINIFSEGRMGVIQDSVGIPGKLSILDYDGNAFSIESVVFNDICEVPLGAMMLGNGYMAVMCTNESELQATVGDATSPKDYRINPRSYVLYNVNTAEIINSTTIDKQTSSGIAIDPVTVTAYRMLEGGFGNLQVINLITGETSTTVGLYLKDILN